MSEEYNSAKKYTKIHLVKMVKCITGLSLKESVEITEAHLAIEALNLPFDSPTVINGRKVIQDNLLNKMISAQVKIELDKEIERLQDQW